MGGLRGLDDIPRQISGSASASWAAAVPSPWPSSSAAGKLGRGGPAVPESTPLMIDGCRPSQGGGPASSRFLLHLRSKLVRKIKCD